MQGTLQIWFEPFTELRAPKLFNLRTDPYECADIILNTYWDWFLSRDFIAFFGMAIVTQFLETFKEFRRRTNRRRSRSTTPWNSSTPSSPRGVAEIGRAGRLT